VSLVLSLVKHTHFNSLWHVEPMVC
jgi:hypothetical protein